MPIEDFLYPFLKAYIGAPQWVKTSIGETYSRLPRAWRYGSHHDRFAQELREHAGTKARELAQRKLRQTLEWAIKTVPAYRQYQGLIDSEAEPEILLQQLPLIRKADIKADTEHFLSSAISAQDRLKTFTGGSTANPLLFYLHKNVSRPREYAFMDDFHTRVGLGDRDIVLALRGRTVPTARDRGGRLWMYDPIKRQLILSSDHLEPEYMPQYVQALREWRPTYIQAFPSALYPLAKWLAAHPAPDITENIRGVLLYSENVYGFQMQLFRELFGCPVLKHFGQSERVLMAATMPDDERYFFWPQYGHFELVDPSGNAITQPGVLGEIVGTGFDNQAMPFIRYRTGDMAMLSDRPGHPLLPGYPVVERIEGRLQEFLVCRDHRLVSITTMGVAHFDELAQVEAIQYEQREPGHFVLKVITRWPLGDTVKQRIAYAMEEKTQHGCTARVEEVRDIPRTLRGKHQMLVQHLDIAHYLGAVSED